MKKTAIISLIFAFTFAGCLGLNYCFGTVQRVSSDYNSNRVNLVIDAGHGGIDAGAIGVDGSKEKDINLAIAKNLYDFASVSGISATLIRDGDYLVYRQGDDRRRSDLYNRMDIVNSIHNSVLISIHQNHFDDEKENGMQIWYSPNDVKSPLLADDILVISKQNLQPNNERTNRKSDSSYYLLHKAKSPSVMVECGFVSNTEENKKLQDNAYQKDLAYCVMLGFGKYITEET